MRPWHHLLSPHTRSPHCKSWCPTLTLLRRTTSLHSLPRRMKTLPRPRAAPPLPLSRTPQGPHMSLTPLAPRLPAGTRLLLPSPT